MHCHRFPHNNRWFLHTKGREMLQQTLESAASSYAFFCEGPVPKLLGGSKCAFYLSSHLQRGQLSPTQLWPPPPPASSSSSHPRAWVRAGRPSPPPSALLAVFTTFPPGQWRTPGDQPEGAGRGGVHASPAFFLQRTLYMVVRGRAKVAPAPRLLQRRRRLQLLLCPPPPAQRRPPRWDPAAAVPAPSQPPPRPLVSI